MWDPFLIRGTAAHACELAVKVWLRTLAAHVIRGSVIVSRRSSLCNDFAIVDRHREVSNRSRDPRWRSLPRGMSIQRVDEQRVLDAPSLQPL